jgi:phenylalanyl-tRNA synthetase beta chain
MAVFETGTVFRNQGGNNRPEELNKLGGGIFGYENDIWQQGAPNFFALKGVLEMLFERIQLDNYQFIPDNDNRDFLHPGRRAEIKYDQTQTFGFIGEIHPELADQNDLPAGATIFEIDLDFLFEVTAEKSYNYHKLVKYPVLSRDLAVVLEEEIAVGDIYQSIKDIGGAMLKNLELFDIYQGDQIKDGYKSAAFGLKFQAADRTLTDQEVNERFNQIVKHLKKEYSAEIRGN